MTGTSMVTDVRIVVEGLKDVKKVCEALELSSLGRDFSATVTSIIPTTDPHVAVNASYGADILIIATDGDSAGIQLSEQMTDALKEVCAIIERVRLPSGQNVEYYDSQMLRDAIEKSIIRSGLKALKLMRAQFIEGEGTTTEECPPDEYDEVEEMPFGVFDAPEPEATLQDSSEDEDILEMNELKLDNQKYQSQISELERRLNELMIDSYEKYDLGDVWESIFPEQLPDAEEIALAASRLSDDVFVSGNFIFAQSLRKVEDFLKEYRDNIM